MVSNDLKVENHGLRYHYHILIHTVHYAHRKCTIEHALIKDAGKMSSPTKR